MSQKRKNEFEKELKNNIEKYELFVPKGNKSEVWKNFKLIKNSDGEIEEFAMCNSCKCLLAYNSKSGTGSLLRHKCNKLKVHSEEKSQKTLHYFSKPISVPESAKESLHKQQIKFVVKDIRPLCVTEGKTNNMLKS